VPPACRTRPSGAAASLPSTRRVNILSASSGSPGPALDRLPHLRRGGSATPRAAPNAGIPVVLTMGRTRIKKTSTPASGRSSLRDHAPWKSDRPEIVMSDGLDEDQRRGVWIAFRNCDVSRTRSPHRANVWLSKGTGDRDRRRRLIAEAVPAPRPASATATGNGTRLILPPSCQLSLDLPCPRAAVDVP
jgi:hypothetical protein